MAAVMSRVLSAGHCSWRRFLDMTLWLLIFQVFIVAKHAARANPWLNGSTGNGVVLPCPDDCSCSFDEDGIVMTCRYTNTITANRTSPVVEEPIEGNRTNGALQNASSSSYSSSIGPFDFCQWPQVTSLKLKGVPLCCVNLSCLQALESVVYTAGTAGLTCADSSGLRPSEKLNLTVFSVRNISSRPQSCLFPWSIVRAVEQLNLSFGDIRDLAALCDNSSAAVAVQNLDLSSNGIIAFPWDSTVCLKGLITLNLSHNLLATVGAVPNGTNLSTLKRLNLSYNKLVTFNGKMFSILVNLVSLDLSFNRMLSVDTATFACHADGLLYLNLTGNQISTLEKAAFDGLGELRELNLSHNQLDSISGEAFIHVEDDKKCIDDANRTHNYYNYSLSESKPWINFDTIDFSHNNISTVFHDVFKSAISNCRHFILSHNSLGHFPRYGLDMMPQLESLLVDHNSLYWLDVGTFSSRSLKYINLSHNKLKKIISMTFLYLPDIKLVDLSHNELNFVYKVAFYKSCKHNQHFTVDLSNNYLSEDAMWAIVTSFRHLTATECVVDLLIRDNRMTSLLGSAKELYERHLLLMDMAYFNVWDHVTLDIHNNPLKCDCTLAEDVDLLWETKKMFEGNITNQHHLDFWNGVACQSPPAKRNLSVDTVMDGMMCTAMLQCPFECNCYYENVTVVNCTRRDLVRIPYDLPVGLKRLHFAHNYITEIDDGSFLDNVTYLDLSSNDIVIIDAAVFTRLSQLSVTLLLHDNGLSELPTTIALLGNSSSTVSLRGNPLSCDCENWWQVEWLRNSTELLEDYRNITCADKEYLEDLEADVVLSACRQADDVGHSSAVSVLYVVLGVALSIGFLSLIIVTLLIQSRRRILPVLMNRLSWYRLHLEEHEASRDDILIWYSPLDEDWVASHLVETLHQNLPLQTLCPYHQCLVQQDDQATAFVEPHDCITTSFHAAKAVVVVLSNNFLATEWPAYEEWQSLHHRTSVFEDDGFVTPLFFLSIEATNLSEHSDMCDLIKGHCYHETSETMWLESFVDNITSVVCDEPPVVAPSSSASAADDTRCDMDWTDDETFSLRDEKY